MEIITELKPKFTNLKSFYNKANLIINDNDITLKSYNTNILKLNKINNKIIFLTQNENNFTQTTNKHINEFLQQFTSETPKTKKQIIELSKN